MVNADLISRIEYSEKYNDENYEYRHVIMPKELAKTLPRSALMSEQEWRAAGIQMSRGWQHFMIHRAAKPRLGDRTFSRLNDYDSTRSGREGHPLMRLS